MNLDEQLLKEQSAERSGSLREEQRSSKGEAVNNEIYNEEAPSLRQIVQAVKRERAAQEEKEGSASNKAATAVTAPIKQSTSKLLQQAWLNLIDSFGLTLIWINLHVFLKQIFGEKFFCKLGEEWFPNTPAISPGSGGASEIANSEVGKKATKSVGTVEVMGLVVLDLGCLLIIIAIFVIVGMILKVVNNPLETIAALLGELWGALWGK